MGGMNEQGLPQAEVNDVGGVADRWEGTFEGNKRILDISVLSLDNSSHVSEVEVFPR